MKINLERSLADARRSFRMFAADEDIFNSISHESAGLYMKMLCECGRLQNSETLFNFERLIREYRPFSELVEKGLVKKSSDGNVIVCGFEQRLTAKANRARKNRADAKRKAQSLKSLADGINKNEKPEGVPESAIVWGGNCKRWAEPEHLSAAKAIHDHLSKYDNEIVFGITFINQVRLLMQQYDIKSNRLITVYNAVDAIYKRGNKITVNNLRKALEAEGAV